MNPENYDPPSFEEVMREKEDTITALRAEVERLGRYTDNAQGQVAQHVKEINALRSQLSARDAEVRALRGFAKEVADIVLVKPSALWGYDVVGMLLRHALIGSDHKPTPLLDPQGSPGEQGPGGEG